MSAPLILRPDEQAVLTEALRRFEQAEVISETGDLDAARIADRLRQTILEGETIQAIAEVPK